jgi:hypothetical protein
VNHPTAVEVAQTPSHVDKRLQHILLGKLLIPQRPAVASLVRQNAVSRPGGGEAEDVSANDLTASSFLRTAGGAWVRRGRLSRNLSYTRHLHSHLRPVQNAAVYAEVGATPKNAAETAPHPASATPQ